MKIEENKKLTQEIVYIIIQYTINIFQNNKYNQNFYFKKNELQIRKNLNFNFVKI